MGDADASWDSAEVERFSGSLKHDWIYKIAQPTREPIKKICSGLHEVLQS
jgi:putative transposase